MLGGALFLMAQGFIQVDGLKSVYTKYGYSIPSSVLYSNSTCGIPKSDYFNLIRAFDSDLPWTGMFVGLFINSIFRACLFILCL